MTERKFWEPGFQAVPNYVINGLPNTKKYEDYESPMQRTLLSTVGKGMIYHLRDLTKHREYIPCQSLIRGDDYYVYTRLIDEDYTCCFGSRNGEQSFDEVLDKFSRLEFFDDTSPIGIVAIDVTQPSQVEHPERLSNGEYFFSEGEAAAVSHRDWGEIRQLESGVIVYEINRGKFKITDGSLTYYSTKDEGVTVVDLEIE